MSLVLRALLSRAEVLVATKICKSKLHNDIANKTFPAPIKIGTRSYFLADEIESWLDQRIAERDEKSSRKAVIKSSPIEIGGKS